MSRPFAHLADVLGVSTRLATLLGLAGLAGLTLATAAATRFNVLALALLVPVAAVIVLASVRRPLLSLLLFAALIPIEEVVVIDGLGTVSRLAGILFVVSYGLPRLTRLSLGSMPVAAWAFVGWATISVAWAIDPARAWTELTTLIQLFVIAVLIADFVVQRPDIVRPVLWTYSLAAVVTAVIGLQYYVSAGLASTRAIAFQQQDPAQLAAILLPALVFCTYELFAGRRPILAAACALVLTAGIVVSGTRGAWVAIGVVVLLFVLPQLTVRRRLFAIATIAASLVVVYQLPGVSDLVTERSASALVSGGAGRTDIWAVGLTIFQSSPLTGVGFANFPVAFTPEVIRASAVASYEWLFIQGRGPHNLVISTMAELGLVGLGLLIWFLAPLVLRRGWGPDAAVVQAALASLVTMALFLDVVANRKQVWLVIGLAAGLSWLAAHRGAVIAGAQADPALPPMRRPGFRPAEEPGG